MVGAVAAVARRERPGRGKAVTVPMDYRHAARAAAQDFWRA